MRVALGVSPGVARPDAPCGARGLDSVLLGPLGPPWSGMESATAGLRDALALLGTVDLVDTAVSHSNATRGRLSIAKVRTVVATRRAVRGASASATPSALAHVPISQNTTGLLRDLALAQALQRPYIAHLHGGRYGRLLREGGASARLIRALLEGAAGIACLYGAQPQELAEAGIHPPAAVIGNALSDRWLRRARQLSAVRERRVAQGGAFRLLMVGLLSRAKGFDVVCDAVAALPGVRVTAIGEYLPRDGALGLPELPREMRLPRNVRYHPPISPDDVHTAMVSHDALILPSLTEGLPMTVLEAMSLGVPVIASTAGGLADLMSGRTIGVIPRVDREAVTAAIRRAAQEYPALLVEAERGREHALARFAPTAVATRIAALRDRIPHGPRPR